jgi:hypothetical protein
MSADGPGPFTYQWRRNGTNLSPDDHLSGVTSSSLAIDPVTFGDAGTYDVLVSNDCGATASQGATVVVYQPGDANGDHHVNLNDLLAVISTWGPCPAPPTSCPADIAPPQGDGTVNVNDLLVVILNWGT